MTVCFQFSLALNFMLVIAGKHSTFGHQSGFGRLMSKIEVTPIFGAPFSIYAPASMILISLAVVCKLHRRVLVLLGIEPPDQSSNDVTDQAMVVSGFASGSGLGPG
eukprot:TRINITY_DN15241_c0_g1_i3.p2 TRINITY_DN15241_c0_g1~~TRINITY_DN15241_c0_g1_i3.p2  ORF type:complete len:106 (+),score=22.28 TRINITY_DN15241_c0_g1_i3:103-420(+)